MLYTGKIVAVHGVYGELTIAYENLKSEAIPTLEVLMVELNEKSYIPFFVEKIRNSIEGECIVKFEEIANREEAKKLISKKVYLYKHEGIEKKKEAGWNDLIGYTIIDQEGKTIGTVDDIRGDGLQVFI